MDIDFVVTWVDGSDPRHAAKRRRFRAEAAKDDRSAASAFRFRDDGEVRWCLRSITNHAPWARRVWLVTDGQFPSYLDRDRARRSGIEVVDHRAIFAGHEGLLPTFNSSAIETMLWRIPGLAERYVFLNDDMALTGPTTPGDFFQGGLPLLRGGTASAAALGGVDGYSARMANGARLAGIEGDEMFMAAHVAHPMLRAVFAELSERHREAFGRNAGARFRDATQFNNTALHDNHALMTGRAVLKVPPSDWVHLTVARCRTGSEASLRRRLRLVGRQRFVLACANDFGALSARVPEAAAAFDRVTGPPAPYEDGGTPAPRAGQEVAADAGPPPRGTVRGAARWLARKLRVV